jgi:hypothetical protein
MSWSASHYPISQLIAQVITDSGLRRFEFVTAIGYRSIQGGLRQLDLWLECGQGDRCILDRITAAYHVDLAAALEATDEMKTAEAHVAEFERLKLERERFRQYIRVEGEHSIPSGITIFGMTGGHRRWTTIPLPQELQGRPLSGQMPGLIGLVNEY